MCEQEDGEVELCCCFNLEDAVVEELAEDIAGEHSEEELRGSWSEVGVGAKYADGIINPRKTLLLLLLRRVFLTAMGFVCLPLY